MGLFRHGSLKHHNSFRGKNLGTLCILQVLNNALPHSKCIKWCLENSLIKCYDRLENHLWQLASKLDFVSYFVCICAFAHYPNSNFSLPPEYADLSVMQVIYGIVNDLKNWVIVKGDVKIQPLRAQLSEPLLTSSRANWPLVVGSFELISSYNLGK